MRKHSVLLAVRSWLSVGAIICGLLPSHGLCEPPVPQARIEAEELRRLLSSGHLVALDQRINQAQQDYEKGKLHEAELDDLFTALAIPDPAFEETLVAWSDAAPGSYAARVATGRYYLAVGKAWRGYRIAAEVHPEQLRHMQQYHQKAEEHLSAALKLAEKPISAYAGLIDLARFQGRRGDAEAWLQQALAVAPASYIARFGYMLMLGPRWGGSYAEMQTFADQSRSALSKAEADRLSSLVFYDQAMTSWSKGDNVATLEILSQGIATASTAALRLERAQLYRTLGRLNEAQADIEQAVLLDPDNGEILEERAHILFNRQRVTEGMADMQAAATRWNTAAIYLLGDAYAEGTHGLTIQQETGLEWIRKSAQYWNPASLFWLGVSYYKGIGLKEDHAKAFWYFDRAAAQNHVPAMNELGLMYWYGQGASANPERAAELWLRVAKNGEWRGKHNLMYFLSTKERLLLLLKHPRDYALLLDDNMRYMIGGLLLLILVGIKLVRRARAKEDDEPPDSYGGYHGMANQPEQAIDSRKG